VPKRPTPEKLTPEQIRAIETGEELSPEEIREFAETLDLGAVVEDLLRLKRHLAQAGNITGTNSRNGVSASLLGVIKFLNRQLHSSPPALVALQLALSDLDDGKVHPLLEPADSKGQPVSTQRRLLWGCAAAVMDCLMQSGVESKEAAAIVGRELSKLNIKIGDSRSADSATSVMNWRWRAKSGDPKSDPDAWVYDVLRRSAFKSSGDPVLDRKNLGGALADSLRALGLIA
jgi:hypothetical protein